MAHHIATPYSQNDCSTRKRLFATARNDYGILYEQLYMYIQEKENIYPIDGLCHNTGDIR